MKTVLFTLAFALGLAIPAMSEVSPQPIHLAVVACGGRSVEETTLLLKSAVLSTRSPLTVHLFTDEAVRPRLERNLWTWPHWVRQRLNLMFYPVSSSGCGSQRLFFPDQIRGTGRVLAVAPDALFLRPVDELWRQFAAFQPEQIAAMADSAVAHDELAQRIARNGREFIEKELTLEEVDRYWADLLREYAALQRFQPQKGPGFVAVEKAED